MESKYEGIEGQDRKSYSDIQDRKNYVPDPGLDDVQLCSICGMEESAEVLKDGLCYVCQEYPAGSYEWHLGIHFKGGDPSSDERDAFRSGWLCAKEAAPAIMLEALEEIKRNCEPWKTADNMAGRLFKIADFAIRKAQGG